MMPEIAVVLSAAAMSLLLYAAVHDLMARTVPNWTSGSLVVLALPLRILEGNLQPAILFSLAIFGILALLWRLRLLGGGDVKLWAAATLLVPPFWQTEYLAFNRILLIGGALALLYVGLRSLLRLRAASSRHLRNQRLWQRSIRTELWRMRRGGPLPYAVAISAGMLVTLWPSL